VNFRLVQVERYAGERARAGVCLDEGRGLEKHWTL
jgi:hypothetical protein